MLLLLLLLLSSRCWMPPPMLKRRLLGDWSGLLTTGRLLLGQAMPLRSSMSAGRQYVPIRRSRGDASHSPSGAGWNEKTM